jgi:hypothetical protein
MMKCFRSVSLALAASVAWALPAHATVTTELRTFDLADVPRTAEPLAGPAVVLAMASAEADSVPRPPSRDEAGPPVDEAELIKRTVRVTEQSARPLQWKDVDQLEYTFQALNLIDLAQTASCLSARRCSEANPILGRNPSIGALVGLKLGTGLLHFAATRWLLAEHPKSVKPFLWGSIAIQGGVVGWNMQYVF